MKFVLVETIAVGMFLIAGCQARLTLEEAQAQCTKRGGLLTVIYTQKVDSSGIGEQIKSPGECISPGKFEAAENGKK